MKRLGWKKGLMLAAALAAAFVAGFLSRGPSGVATPATGSVTETPRAEVWTCSMHPQIRQPKPGKCPICGMDLIPAGREPMAEEAGAPELNLSPAARKLAEVRLAPVERKAVDVRLRMAGKVALDETKVFSIAPRVPGRIDRLYVNFAGAPVRQGDPLADLYSPDLVSAQQELLLAGKTAGSDGSLLAATRERLRLWGLTAEQIAEIEHSGRVREHVTFYAPTGGIVIEKEAREGLYVEAGMRLFTVADLRRVWVQLEAYESDLVWLGNAGEVEFETEAYPGETFRGRIAFVGPVLDPMTRTVKVRVEAANDDGRLKPEMFVRAVVLAATVNAAAGEAAIPLVIPASAPLVTGERAVVYVAVPGKEGSFEGRQVVLGPRAGDWYVVRSGLNEGELVVANGSFKIDSSLQIQGQASMMQPGEEGKKAEGGRGEGEEQGPKTQTHCPVMGGEINKEHFVDYKGMRIYFCCPGCEGSFLKEPEKYLEKMRSEGVRPETAPGGSGKPAVMPHQGHNH